MPANMTTLAAVLKDDYTINRITDTFNDDVAAWKDFDTQERTWIGNESIIPLRVGRNGSVRSSQTSDTPAAGHQGYLKLRCQATRVYGTMQIDGFAEASSKSEKGSFISEAEGELKGLISDFTKKNTQFIFTGGPVMGLIWERKAGSATFGYRGRYEDIQTGAGFTAQLVRLDTYATVGAATQINTITNRSIVFNANIDTSGVPAGVPMAVVNTGAQLTTNIPAFPSPDGGTMEVGALAGDPYGFLSNLCLPTHFTNDRTVANSPVGSIRLRSNFAVVNNTNTAAGDTLGPDDLSRLMATVRTRSKKNMDKFWMSWMTQIAYPQILLGATFGNVRRDASATGNVDPMPKQASEDSSFSNTAFGGLPIHCSDECPDGMAIGIKKDSWERLVKSKGEWIDYGEGPVRKVPGKDEGIAEYKMYYQNVCHNPMANGILVGIADP